MKSIHQLEGQYKRILLKIIAACKRKNLDWWDCRVSIPVHYTARNGRAYIIMTELMLKQGYYRKNGILKQVKA